MFICSFNIYQAEINYRRLLHGALTQILLILLQLNRLIEWVEIFYH